MTISRNLSILADGVSAAGVLDVASGGTGLTASSGANSVMLRDSNQNVAINRLNQANTNTAAAAGVTTLTAASAYSQTLTGTGAQTFRMPDATTLSTGVAFIFNNNATGTLTLQDSASGAIGTITAGGAVELICVSTATVAGTWDYHGFLPENVTWGTNALAMGSTVVTGGTWQGGTIQSAYGGTGLTTFTAANNALYSTSASVLVAGTLPAAAGGTGQSSYAVGDLLYASTTTALSKLADVATGNALISGGVGVAPSYGKIGLTTHVSGTLPVANGGTGVTASTGTGSVVLNSSPSLTTPTIGGGGANFSGSTSGTTNFKAAAAAGTTTITMPATTGTMALTSDIPTVNNATLTMNVSGTGLSGSQTFTANQSSAATFTVTSNATSANTASTIVARDASGNFSAGLITSTGNTINGTLNSGSSAGTRVTINTDGSLFSYYSVESTARIQLGRDVGVSGGAGLALGGTSYALIGTNNTTGTGLYFKVATSSGTVTTSPNMTLVAAGLTVSGSVTATSFSGAGTGLTGTASSLSIGGNAATATTAANGGVTSIVAGTNITISGATGAVTINATAGAATSVTLPSTNPFVQNATTLSANLTISTNNAMAAGPITVNTGVTLTVSTGSRVVIV